MGKNRSFVCVVTLAALCGAALAAWPSDPEINVPLCTQDDSQVGVDIAPDGAGGFIVAWQDSRTGSADIRAQRVSSEGAPLWTADGAVVCDEEHQQWEPAIVSDGAGGAIVFWEERRNGASDVFAQRVDPSGAPLWAADGVDVIAADDTQEDVQAVPDGSGGAIVVWVDEQYATQPDVLAQRIDADGNRLWAAAGVAICTAADDQYDPEIVSDGAGGAIIAWEDGRPGGVYVQRVLANGTTSWTADGIAVSSLGGYRSEPTLTSDGAGGAIVAWVDDTLGNDDIFVQRFHGNGNVLWAQNGLVLCSHSARQDDPSICPDGSGGAIVTWEDYRGADRDVYAGRFDFTGDAVWTLDGVLVCGEPENQATAEVVTDGAGGAIVAWRDWRDFPAKIGEDLYAQRLDSNGARMWTAAGFPVSTAPDAQQEHELLPAGVGAAFVVWEDRRDERTSQQKQDIYAQHVDGTTVAAATMCTIGSEVAVQGAGFGTKKPLVYVEYEKKPGKQKTAKLKVRGFTDTDIDAVWTKKVPLATYPLWVKPKGGQPAQHGEIAIVAPELDPGQVLAGAPKVRLSLTGLYFGTKKGKVLVEYVTPKGKTKRKKCKVVKKTWVMNPATGVSSVDFLVPKLPAGTYDLFLAGKLGEAQVQLTIN